MSRCRSWLVAASVLVLSACDDSRNPAGLPSSRPAAVISDGRFEGGNDDFFFLPPMMADPRRSTNYDVGAFNPALGPSVNVCQLAGDPVANPDVLCKVDGGQTVLVADFPSSQVQVSVGGEHYSVNWHTDDSNLLVDRFYRLQVFLGAARIGYADIDPVSNTRDLKNANTGEVIPLIDGRTLPVKFRIEKGVLCENEADCGEFQVTNTGGTFVTNTGDAGIRLEEGFLPEGVSAITLTIERVVVGRDNRCHGEASAALWREWEGCYEITSDPDLRPYGGIQKPAIAGQCVELATTDPLYDYLQPYKSHNGGELQRLASADAPFLDCEGFEGSPLQIGFGESPVSRLAFAGLGRLGSGVQRVFGVRSLDAIDLGLGEVLGVGSALSRFNWAIGLAMDNASGGGESAGFGLAAPKPLQLRVRSLHTHGGDGGDDTNGEGHSDAVPGVEVVFSITDGDGNFGMNPDQTPILTQRDTTDAEGWVSTPFTAASNSLTNVVEARVRTLDGLPTTFAIAGLPPDLEISGLSRSVAEPTPSDGLAWSFLVRNVGRGVAIPSVARLVVSLEEEGTETVATFDIPVPRLMPGDTALLATPLLAGPRAPGDHSVMAMVNATASVVENNDENNVASEEFTVGSPVIGVVGDGPPLTASVDGNIGPLSVTLRDPSGKPVPDRTMTFAVVEGGGVISQSEATTDASGVATLRSWQLGPTPTVNVVEASAAGAVPLRVSVRGTWDRRLTVGYAAACALDRTGQVHCWGSNALLQLAGSADRASWSSMPVAAAVPPLVRFGPSIGQAACGMNDGGTICWGSAIAGMLTLPQTSGGLFATAPTSIAGGPYAEVSLGHMGACGLRTDGAAYCWGNNQLGEIGSTAVPIAGISVVPVALESPYSFSTVLAGWIHGCALRKDGVAYCWGVGELAGGGGPASNTEVARVPVAVAGSTRYTQLAVGPQHTCALTSDGRAFCWGRNSSGQLGNGSLIASRVPVEVAGGLRFSAIAIGDEVAQGRGHTCALTAEGQAFCWGWNGQGQLGDGSTTDRLTPVAVGGNLRLTALELGDRTSCGMRGNAIWCWGANSYGQLGDGTTTDRAYPVKVGSPFE